jgi:uncharacterized repeat protein (TIGR04076 family)
VFKVKATVTDFLGNQDRYPCHFGHEIGDEVIFDGEKYIGKMCPDLWPLVVPKVALLHQAGPRYVEPFYYYPFWYASLSVKDPSKKKYDGLGYRPVLKMYKEPKYHMANLFFPHAFEWPPHKERIVNKEVTVMCPDIRTAMVLKLEAFDISDVGFSPPYFRRQMSILSKVLAKPRIDVEKIPNEFSKEQIYEIYPPLVREMLLPLVEELELFDYLEIKDGKATITKKGQKKLKEFIASLPTEEREALKLPDTMDGE